MWVRAVPVLIIFLMQMRLTVLEQNWNLEKSLILIPTLKNFTVQGNLSYIYNRVTSMLLIMTGPCRDKALT